MKLKEACGIAGACGLSTVGEAITNITFHATSLFPYDEIDKEIEELMIDFFLTPNVNVSTPIEAILLIPINRIDFGKVGTFTDDSN